MHRRFSTRVGNIVKNRYYGSSKRAWWSHGTMLCTVFVMLHTYYNVTQAYGMERFVRMCCFFINHIGE